MNRKSAILIVLSAIAVIIVMCIFAGALVLAGGLLFAQYRSSGSTPVVTQQALTLPTPTPLTIAPEATPSPAETESSLPGTPTAQPTPGKVTGNPSVISTSVPTDTLQILQQMEVPISNLVDLAKRLQGKDNIPATLPPPPAPLQTGAQQQFWVSNDEANSNFQVQAALQYVTPHVYFWVENGVSFSSSALKRLADTFENKIYPTDRSFFGSEWSPGIDDDVHLYILLARGMAPSVAGYFSSADEYPTQVHPYSNAHEMFYLNADNISLSDDFTYGVLAHEFQHMIHWYRDRNETTWMNEGFSELAAYLNGYSVGGFDQVYATDPDLQLNDWPSNHDEQPAHYGASFLFLDYFLDRFGENATKALVGDQLNGLESVDDVLRQTHAVDPQTGKQISADDVFANWVVASYLQDGSVGDGRYTYHNYADAPRPGNTERVRTCPTGDLSRDVHQYGVDYISITCSGNYTLHFAGSQQVQVVPKNAHSGQYAFWSNRGDESDMTLTRSFDFTKSSGSLTMNYWTWYDVEKDYDYVYVEASTDGQRWTILKTPSGTDTNPSGNSFGWGYTGDSGNGPQWIQESVDLSKYAGQKVQVRFEYITDTAVNGEGFLLDDVSVPQIGYSTDFEHDNGGWQPAGFVRMNNIIPQTFKLSLINIGSSTTVQTISLGTDMTANIPIQIGGGTRQVILVVSGTARFSRQLAKYQFSIK